MLLLQLVSIRCEFILEIWRVFLSERVSRGTTHEPAVQAQQMELVSEQQTALAGFLDALGLCRVKSCQTGHLVFGVGHEL